MELSNKILSDITVYMKYAKYLPEKNRRETWHELVTRNKEMHQEKFPFLKEEIEDAYRLVYDKKVLPSMRSLQFGGKPISTSPNRIYNCAFAPIDHPDVFSEVMFLLLGGTGVGYSVQNHHVEQLPEIRRPLDRKRRFLIGDSIEGWADAIKVLMHSYFYGKSIPVFDFSDIRPKGALLVTSGGKAPGPEPLKNCIHNIQTILDRKEVGQKLTSLEVHDIVCHIADAVLAGGIRRAALISLFSIEDEDMLACKFGNWWEANAQRGRANNSAVVLRHRITRERFDKIWDKVRNSGSGEPGLYFSNDKDWGTNPSLRKGTKVLTTEGIIDIEQLEGKEFKVKNLKGELSDARCWLSGKGKQLYRIMLEGGKEYFATPEHEWPVWNGEAFVKVKTADLKPDTFLPVLKEDYLFEGTIGTREEGFLTGWNIGDGWVVEQENENNNIGFIFSKEDVDNGIHSKIFSFINEQTGSNVKGRVNTQGCIEYTTNSTFLNTLMEKVKFTSKADGLPKLVWKDGTEEFRKGLIDGLYSSDGGVEDPKYGRAINFYTVHKTLADDLSELLGFYGIKNNVRTYTKDKKAFGKVYLNHTSHVVSITDRESILHFSKLFSLSNQNKQNKINQIVENLKNSRYAAPSTRSMIRIDEVEVTDIREDVWDISVYDETHCFQLSHCVTGNCAEIGLRPFQFCNLTEINSSDIKDQRDLNERARVASFIGTLQAGYTDFHYLRDVWKRTTEKDALIGVGMTGIGSNKCKDLDLKVAANIVKQENSRVAQLLGIKPAARTTTVKPSGTSSLVLGSSSGIHAWHNDYYIRRIRVGKNEAIYSYLNQYHPELVEDEFFRPHEQAVISIPQKAPEGSIYRTENVLNFLERVRRWNLEWVREGHIDGQNTHNVSATISVKDDEWDIVGDWIWKNREDFNGLSVLPYDGGTYKQAPFEDTDLETYETMMRTLTEVDITQIVEVEDTTNLMGELACVGASCEVV